MLAQTAVLQSVATPGLWAATIGIVIGLLVLDFLITRKPHEVTMREASLWSAFYIAIPLMFGAYIWNRFGSTTGVEYLTGYLVEAVKVFLLQKSGVAASSGTVSVIIGKTCQSLAQVIFIALGAAALDRLSFAFLLFGAVLLVTAVKILRDQRKGHGHAVDIEAMRSVRLLRRFMPVTSEYHGPRLFVRENGVRAATPFALVTVAVFATDIVFAVDSVPAVYGITGDPFLVFATNAFALLGLRALYFVLQNALSKLVHLGYGLAAILGFIGVKLILEAAHLNISKSIPEISIPVSLGFIVTVLVLTTVLSLRKTAKDPSAVKKLTPDTGKDKRAIPEDVR